jgi:hypothetical protein
MNQMVSMVRLEGVVMHQGMGLKGVTKIEQRPVHDIAMEGPFKKGGKNEAAGKSEGGPKHQLFSKQHTNPIHYNLFALCIG